MVYKLIGFLDVAESLILGSTCLIGMEQFYMLISHTSKLLHLYYGLFLISVLLFMLSMFVFGKYSKICRDISNMIHVTLGYSAPFICILLGLSLASVLLYSSCYYSQHRSTLLCFILGLFFSRYLPTFCWDYITNYNYDPLGLVNAAKILSFQRLLLSILFFVFSLKGDSISFSGISYKNFICTVPFGHITNYKKDAPEETSSENSTCSLKCKMNKAFSCVRVEDIIFILPVFLTSVFVFIGYSPMLNVPYYPMAPYLKSRLSSLELFSHFLGGCTGAIYPLSANFEYIRFIIITSLTFVIYIISCIIMYNYHNHSNFVSLIILVLMPSFFIGYTWSYSLGLIGSITLRQNCKNDGDNQCCTEQNELLCFCKDPRKDSKCINQSSCPSNGGGTACHVVLWLNAESSGKIECKCNNNNNCCCCCCCSTNGQACACSCTTVSTSGGTCCCCKIICAACCSCNSCKICSCTATTTTSTCQCNCTSGSEPKCCCNDNNCTCCCKIACILCCGYHYSIQTVRSKACNECDLTIQLEGYRICLCVLCGSQNNNCSCCNKDILKLPAGNHKVFIADKSKNCVVCSIRELCSSKDIISSPPANGKDSNEFDILKVSTTQCCHSDLTVNVKCKKKYSFYRLSAINYKNKFSIIDKICFTRCCSTGDSTKCCCCRLPLTKACVKYAGGGEIDCNNCKEAENCTCACACKCCNGDTKCKSITVCTSSVSMFYRRVDRVRFMLVSLGWLNFVVLLSLIYIGWTISKLMRMRADDLSFGIPFNRLVSSYKAMNPDWKNDMKRMIDLKSKLIGGSDIKNLDNLCKFMEPSRLILTEVDYNNSIDWLYKSVSMVESNSGTTNHILCWSLMTEIYHYYFVLKYFIVQDFLLYWEDAWKREYHHIRKNLPSNVNKIMLKSKFATTLLSNTNLTLQIYNDVHKTRAESWNCILSTLQDFDRLYNHEVSLNDVDMTTSIYPRLKSFINRWDNRLKHIDKWCNNNYALFDWSKFLVNYEKIVFWFNHFEPWIAQTTEHYKYSEEDLNRNIDRLKHEITN